MLLKNKLIKKDKNIVSVPDVLYTILKVAGITCKENPSMIAWKTQLGIERKIEILSVDQFLKNFGPGMYQIYVNNPEITGIDPEVFKITSLSITIAFNDDGTWSDPNIQTWEEEISPEYTEEDYDKLAHERSLKIADKIKDVLLLITKLWLYGGSGENVSGSFSS